MKYANYDNKGTIIGFYSDDVHTSDQIPKNVIQITDDEWLDCLTNQGKRGVDVQTKKIITITPPAPTQEQLIVYIRQSRNDLLAACDWTQLPDVVLTENQKNAWIKYRQELRDFPETCDVQNPIWPIKP